MSKSKLKIAGLLCASLLLLSAAFAQEKATTKQAAENEKRVSRKSLPAAVQKTAREQSQGAVIRSISKEVEDGQTIYEVELKANGRTKDVTIAADGTVLTVEEEVALAALPSAVKATIEKNAGQRKILLVESVTNGGTLAFYEAHVKSGLKQSEIKVSPDGQLVAEEKKK